MPADDFKGLREALAAGPTPGPWMVKGRVHSSGEAIRIESRHPGEANHLYQVADVLDANGYPQNQANVAYIAACTPETIAALLAELDRTREERDALRDENAEMMAVLPGPYYMDLPDGGDVSPAEQMRRMAEDAARYRWLRSNTKEEPLRPAAYGIELAPDMRLKHSFPVLVSYDAVGQQIGLDAAVDSARGKGKEAAS